LGIYFVDVDMAKKEAPSKCTICGKSVNRYITSYSYPNKRVCLNCLNELIFTTGAIEEELGPLRKALGKAFEAFKDEWESQEK
jgi:hypothetical protein